ELWAMTPHFPAAAPTLAQLPSPPRAAGLQEQVRQHAIALAASQQALAQSEERWLLALQGTNDGLWDWHLDTNEVFFSERWQQISGYQPGELAHHFEEWKQRIHPADLSRVMAALQAHLQGQTDYYAIEHRTQCKDGSYKWVLDRGRALWDATQRPTRMVGSRSDITERKAMEARLIFQSDHDALTGLINRAALLRQIQQLIEQPNCHFVLLFIDLDRFQSVNNSLGHATGDQLIMEFAQALRALVGSQDAIARLSGDEFVVLLKQTLMPPPAIAHLVECIQGALQQLASRLNLCTPISVSVGITSSQQSPGTPQDILRDADIAMHAAKYGGGNQFVAFSPTLREQSHKHLMLESALKQAVERQEFVLHFQPVMCLDPLHPVGIEALVRWQHPERGCISPYEFIPVAEKTGLILPLGQWILERACQHLKHWQTHYPCFAPITLNINVSIQQFYQPGFVATLDRLLATYQIAPTSLRLEITESCLMERTDLAIQTMNALHERQIALCIDDFGTGYSSLSYLHNLPVESLKIDQSFVSRIVHSNQGIAMIKAILAMSQSLGMKVVAEGIETHQQLAKLQELGCRFGQGYLFSQPCDAAAIHHWLHHFSQVRCLAEPPQP
ncbi:MAG TPA: GGDEF and EAL domain-containing protein, partial [Candidatus Obscuribacterales bacterium]